MQKYQDVVDIIGPPGLMPIRGANVTVYQHGTSTQAAIFSDNSSTVTGNPLTTDNSGRYSFYAADGRYDLTVSGAGIQTTTITDVLLQDPLDEIASTAAMVYATQTAELATPTLVQLNWATPSTAPFQLQGISTPNAGGGVGTFNHAMWLGYNAGDHSGASTTPNKPALLMGLEDNYFDNGGAGHDNKFGMEWYVEYFSPNATSVTFYRPYYARVFSSSNANVGATIRSDIGSDSTGTFAVIAGISNPTPLFLLTGSTAAITPTLTVSNKLITGQLDALGVISPDATFDRFHIGVLGAIPGNSNGCYIGWASGISGTLAGDIIMVPRNSVAGAVRMFTGTTTSIQVFAMDANGLMSLTKGISSNALALNASTMSFYNKAATSQPGTSGTSFASLSLSSGALASTLAIALNQLGLINCTSVAP